MKCKVFKVEVERAPHLDPLLAARLCVNGDGRPVSPPSKVICRECQDAIAAKLDAMIARLDQREKEEAADEDSQ